MTSIAEIKAPIGAAYQPAEFWVLDRFPIPVERILVPTDLSDEGDRAIEFGLALAKRFGAYLTLLHGFGAHLTLLHVYNEPYAVEYMRGPHACDDVSSERRYLKNTLKSIAEELKKRDAGCGTEFRGGVPCEEIINTAKERDIDLIVISAHHYNWLTRLAYGCDAEQIFRHAPCPILIVYENSAVTHDEFASKTRSVGRLAAAVRWAETLASAGSAEE